MTEIEITPRQKLINEMSLLMGGQIIDLELDPAHFNVAVDVAIGRYRQRSGNSMEESFIFLDVQPEVAQYTLPDEVQEVRTIYRRTIGGSSGGASVDPFSLAFTNNIYMMQNPGNLNGTGAGTLATYDLAMQYQSLVGRMFGRDVMFTWNPASKKLVLERRFNSVEQVALHVYMTKPEVMILADPYARPWLRDYAIAVCKNMIGEAREMFSSIAGPQGGISLNGSAMKAEAKATMEQLDTELTNFVDQHVGMPFIIG